MAPGALILSSSAAGNGMRIIHENLEFVFPLVLMIRFALIIRFYLNNPVIRLIYGRSLLSTIHSQLKTDLVLDASLI